MLKKLKQIWPVFIFATAIFCAGYFASSQRSILGSADGVNQSNPTAHPCAPVIAGLLEDQIYRRTSIPTPPELFEDAVDQVDLPLGSDTQAGLSHNLLSMDLFDLSQDFYKKASVNELVMMQVLSQRNQAQNPRVPLDPSSAWYQAMQLALTIVVSIQAVHPNTLTPEQQASAGRYSAYYTYLMENPDRTELAFRRLLLNSALNLTIFADTHADECGPSPVGELSLLEQAVNDLIANGILLFNLPEDSEGASAVENELYNTSLRVLSELKLAHLPREEIARVEPVASSTPAQEEQLSSGQENTNQQRPTDDSEDMGGGSPIGIERSNNEDQGGGAPTTADNRNGDAGGGAPTEGNSGIARVLSQPAPKVQTALPLGNVVKTPLNTKSVNTEPIPKTPDSKAVNTEPIPKTPNSIFVNTEPIPKAPDNKAVNTEPIPRSPGSKSVNTEPIPKTPESKAVNTEPIPRAPITKGY